MKKPLLSILLTLFAATTYGQWALGINFDTPLDLDRIVRDTVSNPNCVWQVGHPSKTVFTSAYSVPNVIATDTSNPVPANDTSIFYLKHSRDNSAPFHVYSLGFAYQMEGDSSDYGFVEISPDSGFTWINVLTQDTTFNMIWNSPKPTLSGSTSGWQSFALDLSDWASGFGNYPVYMTADTILFRFTYITDSSSAPHDGWMIDDIYLEDWWEGIQETQNDNLISIYPNPASDALRVQRIQPYGNSLVQILDCTGHMLYQNSDYGGEAIDTRYLSNGIYLLRCFDAQTVSLRRFAVQH